MLTELEIQILDNCGWTEKQKEYYGVSIYDVMSSSDESLAKVVTHFNENQIRVLLSVPDSDGETMMLVFNRITQSIDKELSDEDIRNVKDMDAMLKIVKNTIEGTKNVFMPAKQIETENTPSLKV